ncbi:MAG: hypothetical protein R3C44_20595 [Chloroflexota bacterium]
MNRLDLRAPDGRRVVAWQEHPVMSLTGDLLILDAVKDADPDLILWPVTMQSFARPRQLDHPLLQNNAEAVRDLITTYNLDLDAADSRFVDRTFQRKRWLPGGGTWLICFACKGTGWPGPQRAWTRRSRTRSPRARRTLTKM